MEVLVLLLFISLVLAITGVGFFSWNVREKNHEHSDRLALLPLANDESVSQHK